MAVVFTCFYLTVAIAGNVLVPVPQGELSLSLISGELLDTTAVLLYVAQLVVTYIIVFFAFVDAGQPMLLARLPLLKDQRCLLILLRVASIILASALAIQVPNFGDFIGFLGALGNTVGIYLLPNAAYCLMVRNGRMGAEGDRTFRDWWVSVFIFVFGVLTGSVAVVGSFLQLIK